MATIYLSYSSQDSEVVQQVARSLTDSKHSVVFDRSVLSPGVEWREILSERLRTSDIVVVFISEHSASSKWVLTELGAAMAYLNNRKDEFSVIPVVLDGTQLPAPLQHIQAIFARGKSGAEIGSILAEAVAAIIGRQAAHREQREKHQGRIERTAADFIAKSLAPLAKNEERYRRLAYVWYGLGFLGLLTGVLAGIWRSLNAPTFSNGWLDVAEFTILGLVVIGLLLGLSKYSFVLGKSFMVEALRNADRAHAISYGEFYLNAFSEKAEWSEVKEAFQHWNIDKGSAFIVQQAAEYDPKILELALEFAKVFKAKSDEKGPPSKD